MTRLTSTFVRVFAYQIFAQDFRFICRALPDFYQIFSPGGSGGLGWNVRDACRPADAFLT